MIIKKIILNNIRSYENLEIEFPEGSTLLSGDIGSGKTSILLAIEFALFGLQPGQKGSSILRNGAVYGGVIMEFEIDNKQVTIERTLKRGKSISQEAASITIDDEKRELAVTELKNKVLELIDYPKEFAKKQNLLYKFTVYTPQEEMKQIILQDSETRLNTLRHVFGIDKYKKILENSSLLLAKVREEKRVKQALISNFESEKSSIIEKQNQLTEKEKALVLLESEFIEKQKIRTEVQNKINQISDKIEEKKKTEQEIDKSRLVISGKKEAISSNLKLIESLNKQIKELSSLSFDESILLKLELEIQQFKQKRDLLSEEKLKLSSETSSLNLKNCDLDSLKKNISDLDVCPTCLQDVDSVYKSNVINKFESEVSKNVKKIEELSLEQRRLEKSFNEVDFQISQKEKELSEFRITKVRIENLNEKHERVQELEKSNFHLSEDIIILTNQIESLKNLTFELQKYDLIFQKEKSNLDLALSEERKSEIKLVETKKELEFIKQQILDLESQIKKAEETQKHLSYLLQVEEWMSKKFIPLISNIEKNVMIKLKAEFSNTFSEWFSMLVSDSFNVRLDDSFTPIVEQQDYEIDYAYLSGGERTAIALAYRLALNQVINSFLSKIKTKDLVILDEPTDGFSEQQLDKMRDVLQQLNAKQLIIVSHEQKIEGFVENVIKLKKLKGVSGKAE